LQQVGSNTNLTPSDIKVIDIQAQQKWRRESKDKGIELILERPEEHSVMFEEKAKNSLESVDYMNLIINEGSKLFDTNEEQRSLITLSPIALYSGMQTKTQDFLSPP
jgi:hypothetical protein